MGDSVSDVAGEVVGACDGIVVGPSDDALLGVVVGDSVSDVVGDVVGDLDGVVVGTSDDALLGAVEGEAVGVVGATVGVAVASIVLQPDVTNICPTAA